MKGVRHKNKLNILEYNNGVRLNVIMPPRVELDCTLCKDYLKNKVRKHTFILEMRIEFKFCEVRIVNI